MISKVVASVTALMFSAAVSVDSALAFAHPPAGSGGGGGAAAPELDGAGGIAAIAFLVSAVLVIYNRSRNR